MRPSLPLALFSLVLAPAALARPAAAPPAPTRPGDPPSSVLVGTPLGLPVAPSDTVYFGGTAWDPVEARWEALRDSVWTFESGAASAINADPEVKAVGLHSLLEGWTGVDLTARAPGRFFRRSDHCAIEGAWSLWAGVTDLEADSLGYVNGQGYGNNWQMGIGKTFAYPGTGDLTLRYAYAVEAEESYDFLQVLADTTGDLSAPPVLLTSYTGTVSGTDSLTLTRGTTLPSAPGPVTLIFLATSDLAWSDEDGGGDFDSMCGHSAVDDVVLTGAVTDSSDFETGDDGWSFLEVPSGQVGGDWTDIRAVAGLDIDPAICTGTFGDSALAFFDPGIAGGGHGRHQNNVAVSPWIDLRAPDLAQKVARVLEYTYYGNAPTQDFVALVVYARWLPADLPSPAGKGDGSVLRSVINLLPVQSCATRPEWGRTDLRGLVPADAEQIQVAVGVVNLCDLFASCSGLSNQSPWFDDIRVGVFDGPLEQSLRADDNDLPRDAFPALGSGANLATSTARFDSSAPRGDALGDTLVVRTSRAYAGSRVDVIFRVTPGPGIESGRLGTWLSGFADEGGGWVSGRMDTAEVGGAASPGRWMTAFHEEDPNFRFTDRTRDGGDLGPNGLPVRLANDMFPDDLFTPGTRVDLFYRWTLDGYPGQMSLLPDTTGNTYLEMEVLPSSLNPAGPDTVNNRILFVNQSRTPEIRTAVEKALAVLRPGTSTNAEGTAWDRFDIPNAGPMIPGSYLYPGLEHDIRFLDRYDTIIWDYQATGTNALLFGFTPDAARLTEWLPCTGGGTGGGNGCGHSLYLGGESFIGTNSDFYASLGVQQINGMANNDPCIQVTGNPDTPHFGSGAAWFLDPHSSADLLTPAPSLGDVEHEVNLLYQTSQESDLEAASVSTVQLVRTGGGTVTGYWRSVFDGFPLHFLSNDAACDTTQSAATERLGAVLDWFETPGPTPVDLLSVSAVRGAEGVRLAWRVTDGRGDLAGFNVYRQVPGEARERLNPTLLTPRSDYAFTDADPPAGKVDYWLLELSRDGTSTWHGPYAPEGAVIPLRFRVLPGRPNPFAGSTRIRLELPAETPVLATIFALDGRLVASLHQGTLPAGVRELTWDGRDADGRPAAAGIYFSLVQTPGHRVVGKLVKVDGR